MPGQSDQWSSTPAFMSSKKKRKRRGSEDETRRKHHSNSSHSFSNEKLTLRVLDDGVAPIVAKFPGRAPRTATKASGNGGATVAQLFGNDNPRKQGQRLLAVHTSSDGDHSAGAHDARSAARPYCVAYEGRNYGPQPTSAAMYRYMVGVVNRAAGTVELRVTPHLYHMSQRVAQDASAAISENGETNEYAKYTRLVSAFGARKNQQRIRARAQDRVEVSNITGAAGVAKILKRKAEQAGVPPADQAATAAMDVEAKAVEATRRQELPPYDQDADTAAGVYLPSRLIERAEWAGLASQLDDVLSEMEKPADGGGGNKGGVTAAAEHLRQLRFPRFIVDLLLPLVKDVAKQRRRGGGVPASAAVGNDEGESEEEDEDEGNDKDEEDVESGDESDEGADEDDGEQGTRSRNEAQPRDATEQKTICLLYLRCLATVYKCNFPVKGRTFESLATFWNMPQAVLRRLFSKGGKFGSFKRVSAGARDLASGGDGEDTIADDTLTFSCNRKGKQRLLLYMCALCITINDGDVSAQQLCAIAQELRMTPTVLGRHFKELGCRLVRVVKREQVADQKGPAFKYDARLVLPLTFPKASRGGPA